MSTANNSRPKPAAAPVIVSTEVAYNDSRNIWRLLPAAFMSVVFHLLLLAAFTAYMFLFHGNAGATPVEEAKEDTINAEQVVEEKKDPLLATDIDPAGLETDVDINYN